MHQGISGDVTIDVQGGSITTKGIQSHGVFGYHTRAGDIDINVRDAAITAESTGVTFGLGALALGVYARHDAQGDIDISVQGGSITTAGACSYGIRGDHGASNIATSDGDITITTTGDNAITTTGDNAHGIVAYHFGTMDSRTIAVTVGGTIRVGGENAHGVRIGALNAEGEVTRAAGMGADGYRRQTVTVNGRVMGGTGAGAGVWLAGGGLVVIGPKGSVSARRRASRFSPRETRPSKMENRSSPGSTSR